MDRLQVLQMVESCTKASEFLRGHFMGSIHIEYVSVLGRIERNLLDQG
jgi:hypothetical protein